MLEFFKETMRPASFAGLLWLLTIGVVFLNIPALARWGRRWLTALALLYWILGSPLTVMWLARSLSGGYPRIESAQQLEGVEAVVLLGAGSLNIRADSRQLPIVTYGAGLRALEAARLYHLTGRPLVIASGGVTDTTSGAAPESEALEAALLELDVPADRIVSESLSKNTRDEAVIVKDMLRARGITRFALVTSPLHMPRSMAVFAAQGLQPIAAPSRLFSEPGRAGGILPNQTFLQVGDSVVYEWAARVYYWWKGWLS